MKKIDLELAVGIFVLIGVFSLAYLSIRLGKIETIGGGSYTVYAEFENAGGIKKGTAIEIAGIQVGKVTDLGLSKDSRALLTFAIKKGVEIQEDAIVSIKTKGLIFEKYMQISPGASDKLIPEGGKITETESLSANAIAQRTPAMAGGAGLPRKSAKYPPTPRNKAQKIVQKTGSRAPGLGSFWALGIANSANEPAENSAGANIHWSTQPERMNPAAVSTKKTAMRILASRRGESDFIGFGIGVRFSPPPGRAIAELSQAGN